MDSKQIEAVFPIGPDYLYPADEPGTAVAWLMGELSGAFETISPQADRLASRVLSLAVLKGCTGGLLFDLGEGRGKLLVFAARAFVDAAVQRGELDADSGQHFIDTLQQAADRLSAPPLTGKPHWYEAPAIRWLIDYSQTAVAPLGLARAHTSLMQIVFSALDYAGERLDLNSVINGTTYPLRRYAKDATPEEVRRLINRSDDPYPAGQELLDFFVMRLKDDPPRDPLRTGTTFRTYVYDIARLLMPDSRRTWYGHSGCIGSAPPDRRTELRRAINSIEEYDQLEEDDDLRQLFLQVAEETDAEIDEGHRAAFDQPTVRRSHRQEARSRPSHFKDPWLMALYQNPTRHTPAALTSIEIAVALQSTFGLDQQRAENARLVLAAGVLCGWTKQLFEGIVHDQPPDVFDHPTLVLLHGEPFASVRPRVSVGYPDALRPTPDNRETLDEAFAVHDEDYEPVDLCYRVALPPVLQALTEPVLARRAAEEPILSQSDYSQAIGDLSGGLRQHSPSANRITAGRLTTTFQGWANSLSFDAAARYAVCGRPMRCHEMPINYTRVPLAGVCEQHWQFASTVWDEVIDRHEALCHTFGWDAVAPALHASGGLPDDLASQLTGHAGSWSVPHLRLLRELFAFVREQSMRLDQPAPLRENWLMRRVAFESAVLMCMRDYEFNHLPLPAGTGREGSSFVQPAKSHYWEDHSTYAYRHIPPVIQRRWWACVRQCGRDYVEGPLWCCRDGEGRRQPFDLQEHLDRVLTMMDLPTAFIRAKGLRHAGRTLHRQHGMPDALINLKLNHYGRGYEKTSPVRGVDLRAFKEVDGRVTQAIAHDLKMAG